MTTNGATAAGSGPREFDVIAYPPAARAAVAALECGSQAFLLVVLLWMVGLLPALGDPPVNTLREMRLFGAFFAAPQAIAWLVRNAFRGKAVVTGGMLAIRRRDVVIEVPMDAVAGALPWRVPLPRGGMDLRLRSGRRFSPGLQVADPASLVDAMVEGGATASIRSGLEGPMAVYAQARLASPRGRLEHPVLKYLVYALVPAVPVFRLHQFITYGGALGEYYTFGLKAYLLGFGLWWISFVMGLLMFAAGVRAVVETVALLTAFFVPGAAAGVRRGLEILQRLMFYVGMPLWLALRLTA
jgi:apolipoprotein N-acyltransferase